MKLEKLDQTELVKAAKLGDNDACERMIVLNSGLIWSVARRFFGRGVDADDLYQLGCLGFLKAVQGYDESFGTQFSTYAVPKIAGEMRRFLRDDGTVKVSRGIKERAAVIKNSRDKLNYELGREPKLSELAEDTGLSVEDIAVAETATAQTESLQKETDGFTLEGVLGVAGIEDGIVERVALNEAVTKLPEKERMVILLRYYKGLTQDKTAKVMKVSQVQVSRIEKRAIELLRKHFFY